MEISQKLHRKSTERLYVIIMLTMYTLYRTSSFSPKWVLKTACIQYLFNEYLKLYTKTP